MGHNNLHTLYLDDNDDWWDRQGKVKILEDHVALQTGIIPCSVVRFLEQPKNRTIDVALASMTPEESRRCRRKFRKMRKKFARRDPKGKLTKSDLTSKVFQSIREKAHDLYAYLKDPNASS